MIPTILPGGPRPSGGGGGQAGPSIPPKTILVPAAIAAIEAPAEAKPQVEAPIADAAPPEFGVIASDPGSEPGTAGPGTGDGSGGDGDRGRGPGGDGDGGPGPGGGGAAATEQVRILSGDMEPPRLVERVEPEVPLSLRRPPRDAKVKLRCIIERDGSVRVLNVLSDPARVQREAVDAVERWRYEPARSDGRPISVYLTVEVSFRMR